MHRRATSKKRAVETEQEIDMEDKEATPVEDLESMLPPAEPTEPESQRKQPDKPTRTENVELKEMFRLMMERMDCLLYTSRCV